MVKVSKAGKQRVKRMKASERGAVVKAAILLCDTELISSKRCDAIIRTIGTTAKLGTYGRA